MIRTETLVNKPVYLGLPILEISKVILHEFWYGYVKSKYGEKAKLCYINTNCFIVYTKTKDIYVGIAKDIETRFHTSIYEPERPLPEGKNKSSGLMKDELSGKIMTECVALRPKTFSYLIDDGDKNEKAKGTRNGKKENLNTKIISII